MQKFKALFRSELFIAILLLVLTSAVAYLPFIGHFGYFYDDWYEMFSAGARQGMQGLTDSVVNVISSQYCVSGN